MSCDMTAFPTRACACGSYIYLLSRWVPFSAKTGNFTLWLTFQRGLNPPILLQYFPRTSSLPHGPRQSKKNFRKSAQFRSGRQALHHLSDWKGLVIFHLEQRLLSPGINSQVLGVLFAPGCCACQSLWPRLLSGLSVWDWLLPVPLNYKLSWCIEVYTLQFVPYRRPSTTLWAYAFKCLLLKVGSILSQLPCTASVVLATPASFLPNVWFSPFLISPVTTQDGGYTISPLVFELIPLHWLVEAIERAGKKKITQVFLCYTLPV